MYTTTEYYTVGHDVATSSFGKDGTFDTYNPTAKKVSFFFGGVGDGRHFFQTMSVLAELEKENKIPHRRYHFTLNDIQKAALSRDLLVCMLVDDLSKLDPSSDEASMILNTIFYIFTSTMMPKYAYDHLNTVIDRALECLRNGGQPLTWLLLYKKDYPAYITALSRWKEEAPKMFSNAEIMFRVNMAMAKIIPRQFLPGRKPLKADLGLYDETAILIPSQDVLQRHDPALLKLLGNYSRGGSRDSASLRKHVEKHWHWNVGPDSHTNLLSLSTWSSGARSCFRSKRSESLAIMSRLLVLLSALELLTNFSLANSM